MKGNTFFKFLLVLLLVGGVGLAAANAWDLKSVMKALFADKPRVSRRIPAAAPQELRGRAQELRPDISVPPPADQPDKKEVSQPKTTLGDMIAGLERIAGIASKNSIGEIPAQAFRPQDSFQKVRWAPPPAGFFTADTFNYLIYREKNPVTASIKNVLDTIHGNLMLDLTPFTVVVKPNRILVMLFASKDSYHQFTHLPSWSGASSDLRSDTMYVTEGNSFYPLSVHELTHLYFDGYFLPTISPLWLSEGMAVYMQIHASKQKPSWIDNSMQRILAGEIIPMEEMAATTDLNSYSTDRAELWYTQAYSLVDFLLNQRTRDEFYKFCNELKANTPIYQALYRSYGMPFNRLSVLQNVWLHDLHKTYAQQSLTAQAVRQPAKKVLPSSAQTTAPRPPVTTKPTATKTKINQLQRVDPATLWGNTFQ